MKVPSTFSYILCLIYFFISQTLHSQEIEIQKSNIVKNIGGQNYYIHTVQPKQTLYSISKVYGVSVSDIMLENKELINASIQIGKELRIPFPLTSDTDAATRSVRPMLHQVMPGETFESISKLYNLNINELIAWNPEGKSGLGAGMYLRLRPQAPAIDDHTVNISETDKSSINFVTLMLPFNLDGNNFDDSTNTKVNKASHNAIEFYLGVMMAIDSLKNLGNNYYVSVFDVGSDTDKVKQLLQKQQVKNSHLILGPFYGKVFEQVGAFALENKIAAVSPMLQSTKITLQNPNVSKVVPDVLSQNEFIGSYLSQQTTNQKLILVHNGLEEELQWMSAFKTKYSIENNPVEINLKVDGTGAVISQLKAGKMNTVVVFSNNKVAVSSLLPKLENKAKDVDLQVFGQSLWKNFDNIEAQTFSSVHLHLPSNYFVDYSNQDVKRFISLYREKNLTEPGQMAFLGYDITLYYLNLLNNRGMNFYTTLWQAKSEGLATKFDFFRESANNGFENKGSFLIKYEDNRLIKVQ